MAILAEQIFKIIRPDSVTDPTAVSYEYFLNWYGTDGGFYVWMFYDFVERANTTGEIVSENSPNINKIFESSETQITLNCENLTENQFDVIKKIIRAKNIFRVFQNGTFERLAIISTNYNKRKSNFRYDFEIVVQKENDKIYR
jgi:hypothetical protein